MSEEFDYENYLKQKSLRILTRNKGVKLSRETLVSLMRDGFHLIPFPSTVK